MVLTMWDLPAEKRVLQLMEEKQPWNVFFKGD
jgi:hypothetical protein